MTTLPISHPDFVPHRDVERVWAGKDRHYATKTTVPYDRTRAQKQMETDGMPASESVLARAITAYGPHGRIIRGLIPNWPIGKFQERPWVVAQRLAAQGDQIQDEVRRIRTNHGELEAQTMAVVDNLIMRVEAVRDQVEGQDGLLEEQQNLLSLLHLVKRAAGYASIAAAIAVNAFVVLDVVSDGKLDQHIAWCHVLLPSIQRIVV
jgi:hypothetical protein